MFKRFTKAVLYFVLILFITKTAPTEASLIEKEDTKPVVVRQIVRGTSYWERVRDFLSYDPNYWYEKEKRVSRQQTKELVEEESYKKSLAVFFGLMTVASGLTAFYYTTPVSLKLKFSPEQLYQEMDEKAAGLWGVNLVCLPRPVRYQKSLGTKWIPSPKETFPKNRPAPLYSFKISPEGLLANQTQLFQRNTVGKEKVNLPLSDQRPVRPSSFLIMAPVCHRDDAPQNEICLAKENNTTNTPSLTKPSQNKVSLKEQATLEDATQERKPQNYKMALVLQTNEEGYVVRILKSVFSYIYSFFFRLPDNVTS
jgi:hypothetical protein